MSIDKRLLRLVEICGVTRKQLCVAWGMSPQSVSHKLNGRQSISPVELFTACHLLGVDSTLFDSNKYNDLAFDQYVENLKNRAKPAIVKNFKISVGPEGVALKEE